MSPANVKSGFDGMVFLQSLAARISLKQNIRTDVFGA